MSTITTDTDQLTLPNTEEIDHYRVLGQVFWRCVQPDCDGEHHFWCDCRRAA